MASAKFYPEGLEHLEPLRREKFELEVLAGDDGKVVMRAGTGPCHFFYGASPKQAREIARALTVYADAAELVAEAA
jgi:hypothetical protein